MSLDVTRKETQQPRPPSAGHNGNGVAVLPSMAMSHRLRLNPNTEHKPESYEGLQLEFSPLLFSSLERYLPPPMLSLSRDSKLHYMRDIILRYSPEGERTRVSFFLLLFFLPLFLLFLICLNLMFKSFFPLECNVKPYFVDCR